MTEKLGDLDDATLTRLFQLGESGVFDEIDRRYRAKLVFFLTKKTGSRESAEELTQETMTRAFTALERLQNGVFLSGWLYRIAYRIFVDWLRKSSRFNGAIVYDENAVSDDRREERWRAVTVNPGELGELRRPSGRSLSVPEPQDAAIQSEDRANLWKIARETLTRDEFQVLWHKYVDEFDDAQTARALGKTSGAVRSCAHRAKVKLAEKLRKIM